MNLGAVSAFASAPPPAQAAAAREVPAPAGAGTGNSNGISASNNTNNSTSKGDSTKLSEQALALVSKLKLRDTEVRQHEQAHLAAAGGLAVSGAAYTYQRGPNGVDYAIGGEVQIDTAPGRTPEETIARSHTIAAAALAPAEPSGPDRAVAAQAAQLAQQARADLAVQQASAAAERQESASPARAAVRNAYEIAPLAPPRLDIYA